MADAGVPDAGVPDAGAPDGGAPDGGAPDGGAPDGGAPDGGAPDGGDPDEGDADAGPDVGEDPNSHGHREHGHGHGQAQDGHGQEGQDGQDEQGEGHGHSPHVHTPHPHAHHDHVQEPAPLEHRHDEDDGEVVLGVTAEVEARRVQPRATPAASTMELELGLLRDVPRRSADELLTLAPGVLTGNHAGEGHAPTIYLRGFDAGEGQDIELLVDGIPINEPSNAHGHGYADPRFVIPELVRSVRVAQGPFDPRQGDFGIAGSVDYRLGMQRRGILARGEYGSYDTRRLVLAWAPEDAEEGTFVGVELRDGGGFGPNRAHFGVTALGRLEHRVERGLYLQITGASQSAQWDSAGIVRRDDYDRGRLSCGDGVDPFFCAADANQGGSATRHLLSLGLRWERPMERFRTTLWGNIRQLRVRENFTGQLLDETGDGLEQRYETGTVGLRGDYRVRLPWDGRDHHIELGYVARHDQGDTAAVRLRRELGVPYRSVFDAAIGVTNVGAWLSGEVSPHEAVMLSGGLRIDAFNYAVTRRGLPTMDRVGERLSEESVDAFGVALQPRGTVRVNLIEQLAWLTSAGVGTRSSDAIALSDGERAPFATGIGLESGLALNVAESEPGETRWALTASAGLFHTYVDRELLFDAERGRNVFAGSSNRFGAFGYGRLRYDDWLDVGASFAWTEANLALDAQYFDLGAGDRLPFVPRWMGRLDAAARERFELGGEPFTAGGAAGLTWVGPRPLPNGAEGEAYALLDLSATVGWRFVELGLLLRNIADARYERASFAHVSTFDASSAPSMVPARHYAAGAPFTFFVTLTLHLTPVAWLRESS